MKYTASVLALLAFCSTSFGSINKSQADSVIEDIVGLYHNELIQKELTLEIDHNWESDIINQGLARDKNSLKLNIHGGMARVDYMTSDSFALVVCHEMGHALGGAPSVKPTNKYGSEGQSDYFASSSCIKRYLENKDNNQFLMDKAVPELLITKCSSAYQQSNDRAVCLRTGLAILDLSNLYITGGLNFNTPDQNRVDFTNYNGYPGSQCRVDTLLAGALGVERPACWFNGDKTDLNERPYNPSDKTYEAEFIAKVGKIIKTKVGCNLKIVDMDYFRGAYFDGLEEDELYEMGIDFFGICPFKEGDSISGTATLYRDKIYHNVSFIDL